MTKKTKKNLLRRITKDARALSERFVNPFLDSFIPRPHYLENEEIKLEIRMAPYRAKAPKVLGLVGLILLFPSLIVFGLMAVVARSTPETAEIINTDTGELVAAAFIIISLFLLFEAAQTWLDYQQWRFILTNKRIILVTPDPEQEGLADAIYLSPGAIRIIDTNFSKSPLWGIFQVLRGTRDVMMSPGYEFREEGARVKGGLRFPDVSPEDVKALEEYIFS
jgi:hypothetical protein